MRVKLGGLQLKDNRITAIVTPEAVGYVIQYVGLGGLRGECSADGLVELASLLEDLHSRGFRATAIRHAADPSALHVRTRETVILAEFLVCTDAQPLGWMRAWAESPAEACTTVAKAFPSVRFAAVVAPDGRTAAFRIDRQGPQVIEEDASRSAS
jgi:hypothetical protein